MARDDRGSDLLTARSSAVLKLELSVGWNAFETKQ